jgi:hypothetical protein
MDQAMRFLCLLFDLHVHLWLSALTFPELASVELPTLCWPIHYL